MDSHPAHELAHEYQLRFGKMAEYRARVWEVLCREYFQKVVDRDSTILDLGCGWGEFINAIKARKKFGMDLNSDAPNHLSPDVEFIHQDCSVDWPVPERTFDLIFSSNFFEHLPSKSALTATILNVTRTLKPGGKLICMGPNIRFVQGEYWDFYDHHLALSDRSIVEMVRIAKLTPVKVIPRFLPYTMAQGWQPPTAFLAGYLRLPILWKWMGKQFLVVAQK